MDLDKILKEIESLPIEKQLEVLNRLSYKLKKKEELLKSLEEIRGLGKGLWGMDAQEYINRLRENDRL